MSDDATVQMEPISTQELRGRRKGNTAFAVTMIVSLLVHGSALAGFAILGKGQTHHYDVQHSIPVKLVRLGKKRDAKLLPRIVAPPPPPKSDGVALDTGKTPKPDPKKPKKRPKKQPKLSKAAERLLSGRALDSAVGKLETEAEGDPDGDPFGTATDGALAAQGYQRDLVRTLQSNYSIPTVIPRSQRRFLKARVVLWIEANGRISRYDFVERHPNKVFMGALESMLKTIKLPAPPRASAKTFRDAGVEIIFRP